MVQNCADFFGERVGFSRREIQQRQAGNDRADAFNRFVAFAQQNVQMHASRNDVGAGKTPAEQARQLGIIFNGHSRSSRKPRSRSAWVTPRCRAEFEHETSGSDGSQRAIAAASLGELGVTEPVRCGLASHSRRNRLESVNAAMSFLAMTLKLLFDSNFQATG